VLNFDRSTVKHELQNIQNDCHQWLSDSSKDHQICFRPGAYSDPQTWFKGALLLRGGQEKGRKEVGKGKRREMEGRGMEKREWRQRAPPPHKII